MVRLFDSLMHSESLQFGSTLVFMFSLRIFLPVGRCLALVVRKGRKCCWELDLCLIGTGTRKCLKNCVFVSQEFPEFSFILYNVWVNRKTIKVPSLRAFSKINSIFCVNNNFVLNYTYPRN